MIWPRLSWSWAPGDLWVGAYVTRRRWFDLGGSSLSIYVCVLPCFPLLLEWQWHRDPWPMWSRLANRFYWRARNEKAEKEERNRGRIDAATRAIFRAALSGDRQRLEQIARIRELPATTEGEKASLILEGEE